MKQIELKPLMEFKFFDGDEIITFNIVELNQERNEIIVAVTDRGKISIVGYDLRENSNGTYFEYGPIYSPIYVHDFEEVH